MLFDFIRRTAVFYPAALCVLAILTGNVWFLGGVVMGVFAGAISLIITDPLTPGEARRKAGAPHKSRSGFPVPAVTTS